jgi:outer membrane protein TolC
MPRSQGRTKPQRNKQQYIWPQNNKLKKAHIIRATVFFGSLSWWTHASAQEQASAIEPLPTPLTLGFVLQQIETEHPDLIQAKAEIEIQNAKLLQVDSAYGLRAYILGEGRYIEPSPIAFDQSQNDSRVSFIAQKRLYDFGRTSNAEDAVLADIESREYLFDVAQRQYRIAVMESFFNVLLADLNYIRANEAMSIAFIAYDRAQDCNELGQRSDIEVLEAQATYQQVRRELYQSQSAQRATRSRLANILNRPGELVAEIAVPELTYRGRELPEVEALQKEVLENNFLLKALCKQVIGAEERLQAARAGYRPTLDGEVKVSEYARLMGSYNDWEVSLQLNVPLLSGGSVKAAIAEEQADLTRVKAKLRRAEMDVQQAVLENWQALDTLRIEREGAQDLLDYRDLYLDRSRAEYEMEFKTDLGDSMVEVSAARLRFAQAEYKTELTWARLDALLGRPVYPMEESQP